MVCNTHQRGTVLRGAKQMRKYIKDFAIGDVVCFHGGKFRIIENARSSNGHRPLAAHLVTAHGPSDCAIAKAECIDGTVPGYFWPGSEWTFQGNLLAGQYTVAQACEQAAQQVAA